LKAPAAVARNCHIEIVSIEKLRHERADRRIVIDNEYTLPR